jgi:spore coat polysaccharide biosynthesis protein SpsF
MRTNIIIQARMSSTRLPGKILKPLADKEVLWHIIERCKNSKADEIIIATSDHQSDDIVENKCNEWSTPFVRGDLENVLSRYLVASQKYPADNYVRITGDCPLIDPAIIDLIIDSLKGNDYTTNVINRDFPQGLDVEAFTADALSKATELAHTDREKEHVTLIMRENEDSHFKTKDVTMPAEYQYPQFRLTLDTEEDYTLFDKIYNEFYRAGSIIDVPEVIQWLAKHPEIAQINNKVEQKKA